MLGTSVYNRLVLEIRDRFMKINDIGHYEIDEDIAAEFEEDQVEFIDKILPEIPEISFVDVRILLASATPMYIDESLTDKIAVDRFVPILCEYRETLTRQIIYDALDVDQTDTFMEELDPPYSVEPGLGYLQVWSKAEYPVATVSKEGDVYRFHHGKSAGVHSERERALDELIYGLGVTRKDKTAVIEAFNDAFPE